MTATTGTVSLRAAAKALGIPPTSLSRLLESEPSLTAAVVEQPGPRQAMAINLELLQEAWADLHCGATPVEQLSDRERLRRERQQRLYWQGQELKQQVLALEQQHVLASEVAEARKKLLAHLEHRLESWIEEVASLILGLGRQEAFQTLSQSIHALLIELADSPTPDVSPLPEEESLDPQHSETHCRIWLEHYRARLHQLRARITSKELVSAAEVKSKAWAEARLFRDRLLAIPARCAAQVDDQRTLNREVIDCLPRR